MTNLKKSLVSKLFAAPIFAAAAGLTVTDASATVFFNDFSDAGVWQAYEDTTQTYGLRFSHADVKDGFWLVTSNGENPKTGEEKYAILYGDLKNNKITAYTYDGTNSPSSYTNGEYLATYENAFSSAGIHPTTGLELTTFNIDVSNINNAFQNPEWEGVQFGDSNGIWFHQSSGSEFSYNPDGTLSNYVFDDQIFLDTANSSTLNVETVGCDVATPHHLRANYCNATVASNTAGNSGGGSVPAPAGLALILVGLVSLTRKYRSKKA